MGERVAALIPLPMHCLPVYQKHPICNVEKPIKLLQNTCPDSPRITEDPGRWTRLRRAVNKNIIKQKRPFANALPPFVPNHVVDGKASLRAITRDCGGWIRVVFFPAEAVIRKRRQLVVATSVVRPVIRHHTRNRPDRSICPCRFIEKAILCQSICSDIRPADIIRLSTTQ